MPVLTPEDHAHFRENGYVVVRAVVPRENLEAVIDAIFWFLGMDRNDPADWYRSPLKPGGMVEIYQHQALWNNRQYPRLHQVYSELLGSEKLWVSIDRANIKPPYNREHPEFDHKGFTHWDADTSKPVSPGVQGVLYLADTTPDQGGFQCVPELFRDYPEWVKTQPPDRNPRVPDLTGYRVTPIPGQAGDLIVWDRMLPHGNGRNLSDRPRLAQFISMRPAPRPPLNSEQEEQRQHRIACWRERRPPGGQIFPGDGREWEERHGVTAELTPLGRRLLGIDFWQ